ncbi:MAG: oligosaccharide flippase family protein [Nitrospinota bacterium]|nr:oligosaccharide flippase family protein [Nitrospinota bacterium]
MHGSKPFRKQGTAAVDKEKSASVSRRTKVAFFWNQIRGGADYALYLVFSIIVARALDVTEFGLYSSVIAYAGLGLMVIALGMDRATHVFIPRFADERDKSDFLFRWFLGIRFLCGLTLIPLLFFLALPLMTALGRPAVGSLLRWMGPYILFMGLSGMFLAFFTAYLEVKEARLVKLAVQAVNVLGAVWIYRSGAGAAWVLGLLSVITFLTLVAFGILGRDRLRGAVKRVSFGPVRFGPSALHKPCWIF